MCPGHFLQEEIIASSFTRVGKSLTRLFIVTEKTLENKRKNVTRE